MEVCGRRDTTLFVIWLPTYLGFDYGEEMNLPNILTLIIKWFMVLWLIGMLTIATILVFNNMPSTEPEHTNDTVQSA